MWLRALGVDAADFEAWKLDLFALWPTWDRHAIAIDHSPFALQPLDNIFRNDIGHKKLLSFSAAENNGPPKNSTPPFSYSNCLWLT